MNCRCQSLIKKGTGQGQGIDFNGAGLRRHPYLETLLAPIVIFVIGVAHWYRGKGGLGLALAVCGLAGMGILLVSGRCRVAFYGLLVAVSRQLGLFLARILLVLVFCMLLTPMAIILRLVGKDPIPKRADQSKPSYWEPPTPDGGLDKMF